MTGMWQMVAGRWLRVVVVAAGLAAGLGFAGSPAAAAQSVADVEVRDRLVADQEALLNVYRCMFGVDTGVVPGGCANGAPVLPAEGPAPFSGNPTAQDLTVRDQLIVDQEALLNIYRCQFNIDTELVPGRCLADPEENIPDPVPPNQAFWNELVRIHEFAIACGYYEYEQSYYKECRNHPEDTQTIIQDKSNLYGCEWSPSAGGCLGYGGRRMAILMNMLACDNEGWVFRIISVEPPEAFCYPPDYFG